MAEGGSDFLLIEYSESYAQMRHYDNLQISIIRYSILFDLAFLSAIISLNESKKVDISQHLPLALLIGFLIGLLMLSISIRNRVYFVLIARHVNRIRNHFRNSKLSMSCLGSIYSNPDSPKFFNPLSSYSLSIYFLALLNSIIFSLFFSISVFGEMSFSFWVFFLMSSLQIYQAIMYLKSKETCHPD